MNTDRPIDSLDTPPSTFNRAHFIRLGLFGALAYVAILTVLYFIDRKLVLNPGIDLLVANILYWAVVYKAVTDFKMQNNFEMTLGEGLKAGFVAGLFLPLAYHVFMYLLFNFFDPSMIEVQLEVIRDTIITVGDMVGAEDMPDDLMDNMDDTLDEIGLSGYPFTSVVIGLSQSLMYILIISLIVSAIKKNR